jgi:hypothetical protein
MADQSSEIAPSGNPRWQAQGPRLPAVPAPSYTAGTTEQAHIAWGWSPTAWRQRAAAAGIR